MGHHACSTQRNGGGGTVPVRHSFSKLWFTVFASCPDQAQEATALEVSCMSMTLIRSSDA